MYFNEKLEEEYKDVFEDICTLLDILMTVRVDFEELRDKVMRNDVWIYCSFTFILHSGKYESR